MQTFLAVGFCVVMLAVIFGIRVWQRRAVKKVYEEFAEKPYSYTLILGSYDWGAAVEKIILNLGDAASAFDEASLSPEKFSVSVKSGVFDFSAGRVVDVSGALEVTDAWLSDIDGNHLTLAGDSSDSDAADSSDAEKPTHITLSVRVSPGEKAALPLSFDPATGHQVWNERLSLEVSHPALERPVTECNDWYAPAADRFSILKTGNELSAAAFIPESASDGKKHPLIVWLHGAWEGGNDVTVALMGNKVTALSEERIQSYFNGAFVLCVQTPTFWMQNGDVPYDICEDSCADKRSRYTVSLKKVVDSFVKKNPAVDPDRIYIGGCSNGGYMTLNMLLCYPGYFAAAFPVCEAYNDKWLSDEDIRTLDRTPIWFVAAKNDTTVNPGEHIVATTQRLLAARTGYVLHWNFFDDVHDTSGNFNGDDGKPWQYNGHLSWIYVLNDECCAEDEESLWGWISRQRR
ncbi:MAG: prolyl oligopeptidase family serine peptidase [Treponema sp.]|nr:prolyl oligopeptidase family serine peptidase [Treponema sp.]